MPDPVKTIVPYPKLSYFGQAAYDAVDSLNTGGDSYIIVPEIKSIIENQGSFGISVLDLMPYSLSSVEIQSDPASLGEFIVAGNGALTTDITLPDDINPGAHQLHVFGVDKLGEQVDYYE